jgi:(R,R)-butanediol dehydrogenase / meso-butanediol dehydrogenase / diacetyl reductase
MRRGGVMRADVLHGPRDLRASSDVADPVPAPGEVLVRVARAGLCGSDLHVWRTGDFVRTFPVVPGHEVVGTVVATGDGVDAAFAGRRVVLDSRVPCGDCAWCIAGMPQRCPKIGFLGEVRGGGFAELVAVPAERTYQIPDGLAFEVAVLAEPVAVVLHALARARRVLEAHVDASSFRAAILGAGPVGVLQALVLPGGSEAVLVEPNPDRASAARRITGRPVVTPDAEGALAGVFDVVFDCAGAIGSLGRAAAMARPGGTVVAVALHQRPDALDVNAFVGREVTLTGTHVFADELPEALALLAAWPDTFASVVDRTATIEELPALVEAAAEGRATHLKLAVAP